MKKIILILSFIFLATVFSKAQVAIGTDQAPKSYSILELVSTNSGLRLPHIANSLKDNLTSALKEGGIDAKGLVVFFTDTVVNPKIDRMEYWDGINWIILKQPWNDSGLNTEASFNDANIYQIGNVGVGTRDPLATFHVDAAKDNDGRYQYGIITPDEPQCSNDFVITNKGIVGIGTISPDTSAILDLTASNKGFLCPRIPLNSITDTETIKIPAEGLLIYNTGIEGLKYKGYVFWNGNEWRMINHGTLANGTIESITCNEVTFIPNEYKINEPYKGIMIIPYTGGNGGAYPASIIGPVNGLTAKLVAGNYNVGEGNLIYTITGTPTVSTSTPQSTTFTLDIGEQTCDAVIAGSGMALGELVCYMKEIDANTSSVRLSSADPIPGSGSTYPPPIEGKLMIDGFFRSSSTSESTTSFNPMLVNVYEGAVKFWFSSNGNLTQRSGANLVLESRAYVNLDDYVYIGSGYNDILASPRSSLNSSSNHAETIVVDLYLDNKWYKICYFPIVDNKDQKTNSGMVRKVFISVQRLL